MPDIKRHFLINTFASNQMYFLYESYKYIWHIWHISAPSHLNDAEICNGFIFNGYYLSLNKSMKDMKDKNRLFYRNIFASNQMYFLYESYISILHILHNRFIPVSFFYAIY